MSIKVGDMVETYGWFEGLTGVVTNVIKGYTKEKHGGIEFRITKVDPGFPHVGDLKVGDLEHFVYYNWEADLRIIT